MLHQSKRAVLQSLIESGPISRAALADMLGMSRAAITGLTRQLIEAGVLCETETAHDATKLGRPSILLELDARRGVFAGVSIEQDLSLMVLTDMRGDILAETELPFSQDPQILAGILGKCLSDLLRTAKLPRKRVLGLSVALSGFVNHQQDTCLHSAILGWHQVPFAEMVQREVEIPVSLENNGNAAAVGEKLFGKERSLRDFSVVTFGDGIGCGHYINGQLFRGNGGGAGELAHCTIEVGGKPCRCGKRGCLDTIASRHAVLVAAQEKGLNAASLSDVEAAAAAGQSGAIDVLHRAGAALGLAISHLIQINNPQRVVVVAVEDAVGSLFRTVMRQTVDSHVLPQLAALTELRFDEVSENFRARSAASIAAHRFLIDGQH